MLLTVRQNSLRSWVIEAQLANYTYFRVRRELYNHLINELNQAREANPALCVHVTYESFVVAKQFLTSRNESFNNDSRLAFDRVLADWADLAEVGGNGQ